MSKNLEDEFIETTFCFNDCDEDNALLFPKALLIDIVLCIDVTCGILNSVKNVVFELYDYIVTNKYRHILVKQLRVKVIGFRDLYCDGDYALETSRFFYLPDESSEFESFVNNFESKDGRDEPKNALEAIALAMKSDWVRASINEIARNIIVVFTDASAYPFEKSSEVDLKNYPHYPTEMIETYVEFIDAWQGARPLGLRDNWSQYEMDNRVKRMIVYAPCDKYPWNDLVLDLEMMIMDDIKDITTEKILSDINSAII